MRRLRQPGAARLGREHLARGMVRCGVKERLVKRASARVFIVADDDAAGFRNGLADDDGGAHSLKESKKEKDALSGMLESV